jgi:hypothetical protein
VGWLIGNFSILVGLVRKRGQILGHNLFILEPKGE